MLAAYRRGGHAGRGPVHIAQEPDGSIRTRSAGSFRLPERPDRRRSAGIRGRRAEQPGRRSNQLTLPRPTCSLG